MTQPLVAPLFLLLPFLTHNPQEDEKQARTHVQIIWLNFQQLKRTRMEQKQLSKPWSIKRQNNLKTEKDFFNDV